MAIDALYIGHQESGLVRSSKFGAHISLSLPNRPVPSTFLCFATFSRRSLLPAPMVNSVAVLIKSLNPLGYWCVPEDRHVSLIRSLHRPTLAITIQPSYYYISYFYLFSYSYTDRTMGFASKLGK
jgi:hypothetical protein